MRILATVSLNYKFIFVPARNADSTHDSNDFQSAKHSELLISSVLSEQAAMVADEAYKKGSHYHAVHRAKLNSTTRFLQFRVTVKQALYILVTKFGIFWSPMRFDLIRVTLII